MLMSSTLVQQHSSALSRPLHMLRHRRHLSLDSSGFSRDLPVSSLRQAFTLQQSTPFSPGLGSARIPRWTAHTSPLSLSPAVRAENDSEDESGSSDEEERSGKVDSPTAAQAANRLSLERKSSKSSHQSCGSSSDTTRTASSDDDEVGGQGSSDGEDGSSSIDSIDDEEMQRMVSSVVNSPTEENSNLSAKSPPHLLPRGMSAFQPMVAPSRIEQGNTFVHRRALSNGSLRSLLGLPAAPELDPKTKLGMRAAVGSYRRRQHSCKFAAW